MDREEMIRRLRVLVDERYGGNQAAWSRAHGASRQFGNAVLKGRKEPTDAMLAEAGMTRAVIVEKVVAYREIGDDDAEALAERLGRLPNEEDGVAAKPCGRAECGETMACCRPDCPLIMVEGGEKGLWRWERKSPRRGELEEFSA